jgi:hypothetical protein
MTDLVLGWPQLIYLALVLIGFGYTVAKHGQPQNPHNIITSLVATSISMLILYLGGFFTGGR